MKKIVSFVPHLSIALSVVLIVVIIFNSFNPQMGFMQGAPALVLVIASGIVSILTGIIAVARGWNR